MKTRGLRKPKMNGHSHSLEHVTDSLMLRAVDGTISYWNSSAEELYGWPKEEAVGHVSHDLLQTQFPQPLEEIEAELLRKGLWEGRLVHARRDGARVTVKSRWVLDVNGEAQEVIEINAPALEDLFEAGSPLDGARAATETAAKSSAATVGSDLRRASSLTWLGVLFVLLLAGLTTVWLVYVLAGHRAIEWLYTTESQWVDRLLAGRHFTSLESYYRAADRFILLGTIQLLALAGFGFVLLRKPLALALAAVSVVVSSVVFFSFFEVFPDLIRPLGLNVSPYHAYRSNNLYDGELAWRERPHNRATIVNFKGSHYSPLYGINVPPSVVEWQMDENGFRNAAARSSADIVAIGDSSFEYGDSTADTFVSRLGQQLPGMAVVNLSKAGYNPFHYVALLKRLGVKHQPRYALFGFYEGNDIHGIRNHMAWQAGARYNREAFYRYSQTSFWRRYWAAATDGVAAITRVSRYPIDLALHRMAVRGGYADEVHGDLALLSSGEFRREPLLFIDRLDTALPAEMRVREEWRVFERLLREFKEISAQHDIIPILVYVPAAVHIYAPFSTNDSGQGWLYERDRQIAARKNTLHAVQHLAQALDMAVIDLSIPLEAAAHDGKLLYYRLDSHWNSEGREIAARYVADVLRSEFELGTRQLAGEAKPLQ